ncbi:MAG: RluA family pseudouridine synthase [Pseudomonadota bacterium]
MVIPPARDGERLDKALSTLVPASSGLSRSRLKALIEGGQVAREADQPEPVREPKTRVREGEVWQIVLPPIRPATPQPEPISLSVIYEDAHLIVIDKPVGMAVHPAPGSETGTLVNALLSHCGDTLSGIGGEARPGIVHRIDKDTSGLLVVAKTDQAHQGLAAQFAAHDLERRYRAFVWGAPDRGDPRLRGLPGVRWDEEGGRIETDIGRHRSDRKRMAVLSKGSGRRAVTWFETLERFGPPSRPIAGMIECRLETGRTHQIRVHMAHIGHPLIGDPVYGRPRAVSEAVMTEEGRAFLAAFPRQALHAATLGFEHPVTGELMQFESPLPSDLNALHQVLHETVTGTAPS